MEENNPDKKWFNYFSNMRKKYNMRVSANKPLVLFLDAKDSAKSHRELLQNKPNDFFYAMGKTAEFFSKKYNCIAIYGTDEISFIIEDTNNFIDSINNEKSYRTHDIVSIFSQYFFEKFNSVYDGEIVYWHCKCFSIAKEKVNSYLKFKSKGILKGITAIFLKKQGVKNANGIKLVQKIKMCNSYKAYKNLKEYENGVLYFDGKKVDVNEYINGNIVYINDNEKTEKPVFDLKAFDDLL